MFTIRAFLIVMAASLFAPVAANACSLVEYRGDGRYIGGDLAAQIARKADTIQIVRATARRIVWRSYSDGDWYWRFGEATRPDTLPEQVDTFVYDLAVVETLKQASHLPDNLYESRPRILAYGAREFLDFYRSRAPEIAAPLRFGALPDGLTDYPGHDGYAFTGGAREGTGLGGGGCNAPYFIDVGDTFLAFRDSMGRLYPGDGAFPLAIDAEFDTQQGRRQRVSFNMQSLVPLNGDADPFLLRLRQALASQVQRQ